MNVLLSVFECNPLKGSDSYVGWSYVMSMAKHNHVFALTRAENKTDIERYCEEKNIALDNIRFLYVEQSAVFTEKLYKVNRYLGFLGSYFIWQRDAYKVAKKLCDEVTIDVCHHVSIADFRCAGYLWKLNAPFVFGPVGGGQETPKCFSSYVKGHEAGELFRVCMNRVTTLMPSYKKALNRASIVYSSNDETLACIKKRMKKKNLNKILQMTELCIDESYLDAREDIQKEQNDIVHIIVAGRLIYRKGVQVLLDAVLRMKTKMKFVIDIYGDGDQKKLLEEFVETHSLENKVTFHGKIPFEEMQEAYRKADVYVLPSLRESTGTAVFEALANKLPVITFNQNGAKHIVQGDAGVLINLISKEQVLDDLANALDKLIENPEQRICLGECGFNKLKAQYTWEQRAHYMNDVYRSIQRER